MSKKSKAFSLVEVMVAVFILVVLLPSLLRSIVGYSILNAATRDRIIAGADGRFIIEQMRSVSKTATSLSAITAVDWTNWAAVNGVNNLPSEIISITYTEELGSNGAFNGDPLDDNPLAVTVNIAWQAQEGRTNNLSFSTLITLY